MSNEVAIYEQTDDGWSNEAEDASSKIIQGKLLKFTEGFWTAGQEGAPVPDNQELMAEATAAAWVRWEGGKPVQYETRKGHLWKEREELGHEDSSEWENGPDGKPRDPWQQTKFIYLSDPVTAEAYTFSASSMTGKQAVEELASTIQRKRFSGRKALPLVTLHKAQFQTKFGKKWKPIFKIIDWIYPNGDAPAPISAPSEKVKPDIQKLIPKVKRINDLDDEVPF